MNSQSLRTDVFIEGSGVRRGARVTIAGVALLCDELMVPYGEVFWVSRRKGMLLVFAGRATLALKGSPQELDRLYDLLIERVDLTELRRRIVKQLGHEVVLFTAGCAASGTIDGAKIGGLHVVAVTRRALYLLSRDRQSTVSWPARAASRRSAKKADSDEHDDYLVIGKPDSSLTIRYLFAEEIGAVLYTASQQPPEGTEGRPLELFSRGEVSPPLQAGLPPFSLAAGSLQEVAERAAANVPGELKAKVGMREYFFETHFQELGEIALGPLLLRKSAAGGAYSLEKAIDAMNSGGLQEDTRAAVATAADRMADVYAGELERVATSRVTGTWPWAMLGGPSSWNACRVRSTDCGRGLATRGIRKQNSAAGSRNWKPDIRTRTIQRCTVRWRNGGPRWSASTVATRERGGRWSRRSSARGRRTCSCA
jgi:hypothetical protein